MQELTVPATGYVKITAAGAGGGTYYKSGGKGGLVAAIFKVKEGQILYVSVGQAGGSPGYCNQGYSTFGGGGGSNCGGGSGGGASDVRTVLNDLNSRLLVAGGGGGAAYGTAGGCGGGLAGCGTLSRSSTGGNQTHGGINSRILLDNSFKDVAASHIGGLGYGGTGYYEICCGSAGGGGGGYYGGAGGFADEGGAGGSSYCDPSGNMTSSFQGINVGDGFVKMVLTYESNCNAGMVND